LSSGCDRYDRADDDRSQKKSCSNRNRHSSSHVPRRHTPFSLLSSSAPLSAIPPSTCAAHSPPSHRCGDGDRMLLGTKAREERRTVSNDCGEGENGTTTILRAHTHQSGHRGGNWARASRQRKERCGHRAVAAKV
jgi:hypothetical protein